MDPLLIVLLVIALLVAALFVAGYVANARRNAAEASTLGQRVQQADQHLARAHAEDKGWDRTIMEAAARQAYVAKHGADPAELHLVQVVDMPGTEADEAVFEADGERVVLGRSGDQWIVR